MLKRFTIKAMAKGVASFLTAAMREHRTVAGRVNLIVFAVVVIVLAILAASPGWVAEITVATGIDTSPLKSIRGKIASTDDGWQVVVAFGVAGYLFVRCVGMAMEYDRVVDLEDGQSG